MRDVARLAARQLRSEVAFRGTFTVDGVVDADGFWPTELNPRFGAGINVIARAAGNPPLPFIHDLIVGEYDIGIGASDLERVARDPCRQRIERAVRGPTPRPTRTPIAERPAMFDGRSWRWAEAGATEDPSGTVLAGPHFARCVWNPAVTPVGPSVAPRATAFWRFADRELATGLGPLTAAPDPFD